MDEDSDVCRESNSKYEMKEEGELEEDVSFQPNEFSVTSLKYSFDAKHWNKATQNIHVLRNVKSISSEKDYESTKDDEISEAGQERSRNGEVKEDGEIDEDVPVQPNIIFTTSGRSDTKSAISRRGEMKEEGEIDEDVPRQPKILSTTSEGYASGTKSVISRKRRRAEAKDKHESKQRKVNLSQNMNNIQLHSLYKSNRSGEKTSSPINGAHQASVLGTDVLADRRSNRFSKFKNERTSQDVDGRSKIRINQCKIKDRHDQIRPFVKSYKRPYCSSPDTLPKEDQNKCKTSRYISSDK